MAAEAALRVGAGLVTVATRPEHVPIVSGSRPEIMCHQVREADELAPLLSRCNVVVIGPGLGQSEWAENLLAEVLRSNALNPTRCASGFAVWLRLAIPTSDAAQSILSRLWRRDLRLVVCPPTLRRHRCRESSSPSVRAPFRCRGRVAVRCAAGLVLVSCAAGAEGPPL